MPTFLRGEATLRYEDRGEGFPLLALAPGGMRSTVDFWANAAIDPLRSLTHDFRVIAMDQRNAGSSTGPLEPDDPWGMYADDQLAVLDHLGIERFAVLGCCIGGSFIFKLIEQAPERVVAAVLEQPIGVHAGNRDLFAGMQDSWTDGLLAERDDVSREEVEAFLAAMWAGDFVVSVPPRVIENCTVPLLVLPGVDDFHPTETGRRIASMAPTAEIIEPWKDTPERVTAATEQVRAWLLRTTGAERRG